MTGLGKERRSKRIGEDVRGESRKRKVICEGGVCYIVEE